MEPLFSVLFYMWFMYVAIFCIVSDFGVSDDMDIVDFRVKLYK